MKKSVQLLCVALAALVVGWGLGSAFPIGLWAHSDCHRLGGSLRATAGPGKAMECVIPLADR